MELETAVSFIAENIALDNKNFRPDQILPYLKQIINKFIMIIDSRFSDKREAIRIVETQMDGSDYSMPFYMSLIHWEKLYEEAKIWAYHIRKGKIVMPSEIVTEVEDFYENGYDAGKRINQWPIFSGLYRIAKREFTVIYGIPSHGKSEFTDAMLVNLANEYDFRFAVFSPENFPFSVHAEKLLSKLSGMPFHPGPNPRMGIETLRSGMEWINKHFCFIAPHEDEMNLESVLGLAQQAIDENKIDGVLIDPWNEIDHSIPQKTNETNYIGACLSKCRRFARVNNICFWVVAHPAKIYKERDKATGIEKKEFRVPSPYDISGSANWFNKSDNCLCVYRHADNSVSVHIQKIKYKMRGEHGEVHFSYNRVNGKYTEINQTKGNAEIDF